MCPAVTASTPGAPRSSHGATDRRRGGHRPGRRASPSPPSGRSTVPVANRVGHDGAMADVGYFACGRSGGRPGRPTSGPRGPRLPLPVREARPRPYNSAGARPAAAVSVGRQRLLARPSDAWAWLRSHALIGFSSRHPQGSWYRVTTAGAEILDDPRAVAKVWPPSGSPASCAPALSSARSNSALGDYETASFAAMKAVEVEVRRVAGLPNGLLGVALMREAFQPGRQCALRSRGRGR